MRKQELGTIVSFISGVAFATLAILAKFAYAGGANVPSVLFLRFSGAALLFWLYNLIKGKSDCYDRVTVLKLLLLGGAGYGSMSAFFLLAVSRIPASLAGMLLYLYPSLVSAVTVLLKMEKMNAQKGLALLTTFTGMVFVLGASFQKADLIGVLCAVGAACVYTVYIVAGSRVIEPLEPVKATTYVMAGGALVYGLTGLLTGALSFDFAALAWYSIGGMIIFSTVLAVGCFWLGIKWIGPSKTSIISTVEPLATVVMARVVFEEVLTMLQLLGGVLILLGIVILQPAPAKEGPAG
ncbi:MAG: DMT family transporter [Peptococcaceae bacterium]|jgi:drug/metabolite transporter (DMT)-like permease|nr:DMT family transporter [Peptococcaceae bacterium]MDH7525226.1 DMT family transporter [Peptococcaceae bacterium]